MTKITPFMIFLLSLFIIINILISSSLALISDKRLCYDEQCSEPVSLAKTLSTYFSNDKNILSFKSNQEVKVFSKSAGKRLDLWGVEILGKRGYVPKTLIREYSVLKKSLSFEVPTEFLETNVEKPEVPQVPQENTTNEKAPEIPDLIKVSEESITSEKSEEKPEVSVINSSAKDLEHSIPTPENVSPRYEVIDGTTIPLAIDESDYSSQPVEDAEEPVLSVHPHPSLVSSTLSFVSKAIDKVAEQFNTGQKETVNDSENQDKNGNEAEKSEKSTESEEGVLSEKEGEKEINDEGLKNEELVEEVGEIEKVEEKEVVKEKEEKENVGTDIVEEHSEKEIVKENEKVAEKEEETKKQDDSTMEGETLIPKDVDEIEEKVEKHETLGETDSLDGSEENEESDEEDEGEEEEEEEETKLDKEESMKEEIQVGIESEKKVDFTVVNNETADEPNVLEVDEKSSEVSEKVPLSEDFSVNDFTTERIVTDQVPLPETQEGFKLEKDENIVVEKDSDQNVIQEKENIADEVYNQIPQDFSSNISESIVENKMDVNIVDSENIRTDYVSNFEASQIGDFIQKEAVEKRDVFMENEFSGENNDSRETNIHEEKDAYENILGNVALDGNKVVSEKNDFVSMNETDTFESLEPHFHDELEPRKEILAAEQVSSFNELPSNRNLLNIDEQFNSQESQIDKSPIDDISSSIVNKENINNEEKLPVESLFDKEGLEEMAINRLVLPPDVCVKNSNCPKENMEHKDDNAITYVVKMGKNYWEFLAYLIITSVTILVFSLGYYYIENARRDNQLIAKINKLEKELMVSTKECTLLNENLTCTKTKLNSIEDESFGSNEMVTSLKNDLEASQNAKLDLEDQVATLEKELETATEAGLELERMLREFLSSNNEDNPLAQSIEDLQARLNAQQAENEALTNAFNLKKQETESMSSDLLSFTKKYQELEIEVKRLEEELKTQGNMKIYMEQTLEDKIQRLEIQMREAMDERSQLRQGLKAKELEINHLLEVVDQENSNNLDFDKLYDSVQAKAEALQLAEERDELRLKLQEADNDYKQLEVHIKSTREEVISLTEECKAFEKDKKDAETKLEVLSNFFKEKEAQRQKEEAAWLEKQGEVSSTVERIHTMQNEIQNYKQQVEILKREIVDQEREYKGQIGALETKAHEHWVVARQNERRLEELKAESGQLRNRLTIVEKSMNDPDPDVKLHRMDANGETATSPSLFLGPESSSSPIMFSNSSGVPPPPPPSHYMFGPPFPPYMPPPLPGPGGLPPFDVGQRPPPLGGRLSSPQPLPLQAPSGRYDNTGSPPPLSPPLPHHFGHRRSPPPPFSNDRIHHHHHPHPPPPPPSLMPIPSLGTSHNWGEESLPPLRNSGFHPHQRDQRSRNHKGSLHSSGESLDKSHHSGKV